MSVTVITYHRAMGRWEPDARGRLRQAAMELYAERGFEQATVAEIAARAGLTERTFFRHFADKREVLFAGSEDLQQLVVAAVERAPATSPPRPASASSRSPSTGGCATPPAAASPSSCGSRSRRCARSPAAPADPSRRADQPRDDLGGEDDERQPPAGMCRAAHHVQAAHG